ncbi:MAG: A24 family peptidase [Desulfobacteraceae bacterium]
MNPIMDAVLMKVLVALLLVIVMIDLHTFRIPNLITMPFALMAMTYYGVIYGYAGLLFSLAGLGIGMTLLLVPYMMGGLGGGDVKFFGMVGAFLGPKVVVTAFFFVAIVGGVYAVNMIILHSQGFRSSVIFMRAALFEFILTRNILLGSDALCSGRPRLKYGMAIAFGTGLFLVIQANGYTFY